MVKLAELPQEELFTSGHRLCAGCGPAVAMRIMTKALRGPTIITTSTGCVEVGSTIYPYTCWNIPWVHSAFENAASTAAGIEGALKALSRRGIINEKIDIVAIGGDGGTFDIGLQALSGALERRHDFLYVCYDNEAYMNTGVQRSGATPYGASTTTSPAGRAIPGKLVWKKNIAAIAAAHGVPYVATASIAYWNDYISKVRRGLEVDGPAFVHVYAPCPLGWRIPSEATIQLAQLAVQTRVFPLYEIIDGRYVLSLDIPKPKPVEEYLKIQGRFKHLFTPECRGEVDVIQADVERRWAALKKLCSQ
ncbi:MAG: thiamine pyrophosphate-dependent enzyme [Candidatus Bathyarchaeia archaeon]